MVYKALDIAPEKLKHRSWNAKLIPKKLQELALAGEYYESKVLEETRKEHPFAREVEPGVIIY